MIPFSKYINTFKKKYVAVEFTPETEKLLRAFALAHGFNLTKNYSGKIIKPEGFKFHTTVFYTTSLHNTPEQEIVTEHFKMVPDHYELFGTEKNIPVLKLKVNDNLFRIRELFINQGYKDSWPDYRPHISFSYDYSGDIKDVPLPKFDIVAEKIIIRDQDSS